MSLQLKDLTVYFFVLTAFIIGNLSFTFMPWNAFIVLTGAVTAVAAYAYVDLGGSFQSLSMGKDRELKVEPVEAPTQINRKARESEMWKMIDLEKTGKSSTKIHVDTQDVRIDGDKTNLMFGIIGMAKHGRNKQYVAYIYDLHEDRIRKYDSQRYESGERVQPFKGKYSWLTARGLERQVMGADDSDGSRVVINQNTGERMEEGGG